MTHKLNMVSYSCLCVFHHSINADRLFSTTYRCADVAVPLPHHGRCLSDHVHPIHRTRRHLRPLSPRSFLVFLHALLAPIIDIPEPNLSLSTIFDTPSVSPPSVTVPAYATPSIGNSSLGVYCLLWTPQNGQ